MTSAGIYVDGRIQELVTLSSNHQLRNRQCEEIIEFSGSAALIRVMRDQSLGSARSRLRATPRQVALIEVDAFRVCHLGQAARHRR